MENCLDIIGIEDNETAEEPLFVESAICCRDEDFTYDEEGSLALTEPVQPIISLMRPCSLLTLKGSWILKLTPTTPHLLQHIRGPMRIEVQPRRLRVSGDIYVKRTIFTADPELAGPFVPGSLIIRRNWYPAFPQKEYRWYFRSTGVRYSKGELLFKFERHLWSDASQSFVSQDNGWMKFECKVSLFHAIGLPRPTIEMKGTAMIGGTEYNLAAVKTSPYYRGCLVEVDVMKNRQWPASATSCDETQTVSYNGVYRSAGMDFRATMNEVDVSENAHLTIPELHTLLATHRSLSAGGNNWHLWLLVGSRMDGTYGIMFDTGHPPHREGAVGFYDPALSNSDIIHAPARGKKLGEVPLAFLRTLIHEAGHAFNLYHPKHDVHDISVGTTIMNQTGDVMGFATASNPYPCNATMAFNDHNQTSLIHSPDPQVKPGWKEFGWGHGSVWSGIAEPVDAIGLDEGGPESEDLRLKIDLPAAAVRGELVNATVTVENIGTAAHDVTTALNLCEGYLRVSLSTPSGQAIDIRDVVLACGPRRMIALQPNGQISGTVQLFYGPHGLTFDQPGRYEVRAELSVGDGTVTRSESVALMIRSAVTDSEREIERLTMDESIGLSIALGDFGTDTSVHEKLMEVTKRFADTNTGAACAMVVANSLARDLRDIRNSRVLRLKDEAEANRVFDEAIKGRDAVTVARLSTAVVSPRETAAPLLDMVEKHLEKARGGTYADEDRDRAIRIIADHIE